MIQSSKTTSQRISGWQPSTRYFVTFLFIAVGAMLTILLLVGVIQYESTKGMVIENAKTDSIIATTVVRILQGNALIHRNPDGTERLMLNEEELRSFNRNMHRVLREFEVVKVKFYDDQSRIVYCTDHSLIGQLDLDNDTLRRTLEGEVLPKVQKNISLIDLEGNNRNNIDVVETYVPLYGNQKQIIGAFEVYMDLTPYLKRGRQWLMQYLFKLGVVVVAMFAIMAVLMWKATRIIHFHHEEIQNANRELRIANDRLNDLATTDELTGLLNRRAAMERMEEAWALSIRNDSPLSCILIDVDHFKRINDKYGHGVGDEVLRRLSVCMAKGTRAEETICRLGGEEFLIICPMTTAADASIGAKRLRRAVEAECMDSSGNSLTISLGVAERHPQMLRPSKLLIAADEALYRAKDLGRNCVCIATDHDGDETRLTG